MCFEKFFDKPTNKCYNVYAEDVVMNERLKQIRKELGMSQTKFVEGTGISATAVGLFETGKTKKMSDSTMGALCDKHGINMGWLKHGTEPKFSDSVKNEIGNYILTNLEKKIIEMYLEIPPEKRESINRFIKDIWF
jgi:transcriptional regulator with XRE-family HTH domain